MQQLGQYALLARTNRLSLLGVRRKRRIGQDHDFERLRDYTLDDNYKHIEWRATARRRKLTVKDFQSSQSQRIIFLMDCGRMMTNEAAGLSLLDHALNAMLMLGYVALRQGDSAWADRLLRRDPQFPASPGRHEPDEPPAARLVRPLSAVGRIALRPGLPLPRLALPQTIARGVGDQPDRRGQLEPGGAVFDESGRPSPAVGRAVARPPTIRRRGDRASGRRSALAPPPRPTCWRGAIRFSAICSERASWRSTYSPST